MVTKSIAWNTGTGNIILTYQGQDDGTISVQSDTNNLGSARSQVITIKTNGSPAITRNVTVSQSACPFPVGDVRNFQFTGTVQSVFLPPGKYKLQCWGAQGGSNGTDSEFEITAQPGGKGGYAEGILTLTQNTTVYVFVGGQGGSSGNGGWNGGGGGTGTTYTTSLAENGMTKVGCGGGATDIALVTSSMSYSQYVNDRSWSSRNSRFIVAGGGSGGACSTTIISVPSKEYETWGTLELRYTSYNGSISVYGEPTDDSGLTVGKTYRIVLIRSNLPEFCNPDEATPRIVKRNSSGSYVSQKDIEVNEEFTLDSDAGFYGVVAVFEGNKNSSFVRVYFDIEEVVTVYTPGKQKGYQSGYAGGGVNGCGYNDGSFDFRGKQGQVAPQADFGTGAKQGAINNRYHGGLGGGGWYGGGLTYGNGNPDVVHMSGGGSGFVNIAANAQYRPSGYTGLELDSGSTVDGEQTFEAPAGGTETGHSGNGYARITKLAEAPQSETLIATITISYTGEHSSYGYMYGSPTTDGYGSNIVNFINGKQYKITCASGFSPRVIQRNSNNNWKSQQDHSSGEVFTFSQTSGATVFRLIAFHQTQASGSVTLYVYRIDTSSSLQ